MSEIELRHVYKLFGPNRERAVRLLKEGRSRDEVRRETGAVAAVIDANLEIQQGEVFVVMGLSGSGKSTLVRTINRLFEPTDGEVFIADKNITNLAGKELRSLRSKRISMVFQHFALLPHRTVLDNAAWGLEAAKVPVDERRERAQSALEKVGLGDRSSSYPGQLSGGMQQRVGLARALATEADILLMDEAFSALDPLIRREMQDQMLDLQETLSKTIVFITHDLNEAMRVGDRIAVMKDGRIVQVGTSEEILQDPANDYVASFVQDVDRSRVLTASAVMRPPMATLLSHEGPLAAIRTMRENQVSGLFVVGPHRRLHGAVSDEAVAEAAKRNQPISEVLIRDVPTVGPETPLVEMFAPAAASPIPLAVVDDENRLLGVVPRVTLLMALVGENGNGNGDGVPEQTDTEGNSTAPEASQPTGLLTPEGTEGGADA